MVQAIFHFLTAIACLNDLGKLYLFTKLFVSIRSTPYCISQNNIVTLHGGIIFLILRQEYKV